MSDRVPPPGSGARRTGRPRRAEVDRAILEATRAALTQEQDQLRQRTAERDLLNTRCERIKKGLQTLLGQDDASAAVPATSGAGL